MLCSAVNMEINLDPCLPLPTHPPHPDPVLPALGNPRVTYVRVNPLHRGRMGLGLACPAGISCSGGDPQA